MARHAKPVCPVIPASVFTFRDHTFAAERSDLKGYGDWNTLLTIRNDDTGKEVQFTLAVVKRDREGDVEHWLFRSLSEEHPHLYIKLWND